MSRGKEKLHNAAARAIRHVLIGLILAAFRPKLVYASEKAKREAFAEPRVIIVNHVRGWDGAVVYAKIRKQQVTALVAKDMIDADPKLRRFLTYLPTLPIDRQHASLSWLRDSRKLIREGQSIMIFPEGKCQFDRVMKPFKSGCVMLSSMSGASILPVYHTGVYHWFFGRRHRIIIGEPVALTPPPEGVQPEELERQAEALFRTMNDLERQLTGKVRTLLPDGSIKEV